MAMDKEGSAVKENVVRGQPLAAWWLAAALVAAGAALLLVAHADSALPAPLRRRDAPPDRFTAEAAYDHLLNLTAIGPRVAGSYENEVLAVRVLVEAARAAQRAARHNRVELDVFTADGAFPLAFLDGMNHVYRGVSSVAARVSGRGARRGPRPALLFNCHYDTVPDSPGASDDGAGCAVLLETLRALAAAPRPLRHDAVFLFNGAEENVLQASHGFVTRHAWAGAVRAFVNLEACGVGGREVVFQAGPRAPWLVEAYAAAAPRPFASSLAQELFRSGLIPADTDFRIFRDFGNLSGLDLAWSADGYAYHTRLDAAARVPPAALQRTGDNVLALAHELLWSEQLGAPAAGDEDAAQPVFFDVLGLWVVTARAPAAAAGAALALALLALDLLRAARHARARLFLPRGAWARAVAGAAAAVGAAFAAGVAAAAAVALLLAAAGRPLACYSRPWLLVPLYVLPALASEWFVLRRLLARWVRAPVRGWWAARAVHAACGAWAGGALAACAAAGLRSGFLPALWVGGGAAAGALAPRRWEGGRRAALAALAAAPAALQTLYLAVGSLRMLVPIAGRAGAGAVPAEAALAALAAALALAGTAWLLPPVAAARPPTLLSRGMWAACAAAAALVWLGGRGAAYSPDAPQRLMVFHTRRTHHAAGSHAALGADLFYWIPDLDDNTGYSLSTLGGELRGAAPVPAAECARWVWCGAPYYLPVVSLVARSHAARTRHAPRVRLAVNVTATRLDRATMEVRLAAAGAQHVVVIVAAAPGARVLWSEGGAAPLEGPRWTAPPAPPRRVYFFALHDARAARPFSLTLRVQRESAEQGGGEGGGEGEWAALSVAGHALFGPGKEAPAHARLLAALPRWVAATGWGVDLHLYSV